MTRLLSVAAIVSATLQFVDELAAGDEEGMIIAGLGGAGALLSLAGFLGFAGTLLGGSVVEEFLASYGLAVQHTMHIVGEEKLFVKARLPQAADLDKPKKEEPAKESKSRVA